MRFYDALQMDPSILKRKIAQTDSRKEKNYYWAAMTLRSLLIVAFAIVFISSLSNAFGQENMPMAVVLFCFLLGVRFVNFEYCVRDSLLLLAVALGILLVVPTLVQHLPAGFAVVVHFVAFFSVMYITSQRPELGNGGLYSFAYVYLTGNPVEGAAFEQRFLMTVVGYVICAAIFFFKHRQKNHDVSFVQIIRRFDLNNPVHLWMMRMALGVSLVLTAGSVFHIERFMWMGFACASLLSEYPYSPDTTARSRQRIVGAVAGSAAFFIFFQLIPVSMRPVLGVAGGFCLGFCTDYRYKTAMNCFGALMLAASIYGVQDAVLLRVADTALGVVFAVVFALAFHKLVAWRFVPKKSRIN